MFTKTIKISALIGYFNIAINIIVGILITPYLINSLGTKEYGLYTLVIGAIMLMSTFDFGLSGTITRFVAKYRAENNYKDLQKVIDSVQFLFVIVYVTSLCMGLSYIAYNQQSTILSLNEVESMKALVLFSILLPCIPAIMQTAIYTAICNGSEAFIFPRALELVKYIIRTLLIIAALNKDLDSITLVLIDLVLICFVLTIISFYTKRKLSIQPCLNIPEFSFIQQLAKYTFWLFTWSLCMQFFWKAGQFAVAKSIDISAVTIYSLCIMLGSYYGSFVGAYTTMFLPTASKKIEKNSTPSELLKSAIIIGKANAGILLFILGAFFSVGNIFITLWVGDLINAQTVWYGSLLIMVGFTLPLTQSFLNQLLEAKGLVKYKAITCLLFLPISIFIAQDIGNVYGVLGIITVMLLFWLASQIVMNIYYYKILKINVFVYLINSFGPWILPLVLAAIAVTYVQVPMSGNIYNFIFKAMIYTLVYGLTFLLARKTLIFLLPKPNHTPVK